MSKNNWLGRVLIGLLVVVVLAAAGFAVYRLGYARGVISAGQGGMPFMFADMPGMPHDFVRGQGFVEQDHRMQPGGGFGRGKAGFEGKEGFRSNHPFIQYHQEGMFPAQRSLVSPFSLLFRIIFYGVILWLIYKVVVLLLGGQGWQLSFKRNEAPAEEEALPEKSTRKKS